MSSRITCEFDPIIEDPPKCRWSLTSTSTSEDNAGLLTPFLTEENGCMDEAIILINSLSKEASQHSGYAREITTKIRIPRAWGRESRPHAIELMRQSIARGRIIQEQMLNTRMFWRNQSTYMILGLALANLSPFDYPRCLGTKFIARSIFYEPV